LSLPPARTVKLDRRSERKVAWATRPGTAPPGRSGKDADGRGADPAGRTGKGGSDTDGGLAGRAASMLQSAGRAGRTGLRRHQAAAPTGRRGGRDCSGLSAPRPGLQADQRGQGPPSRPETDLSPPNRYGRQRPLIFFILRLTKIRYCC
jgi:hypothetical protein